jgi:hypothetical protein
MLADSQGRVVYRVNSPRPDDWRAVKDFLNEQLPKKPAKTTIKRDGVAYPRSVLARTDELRKPIRRDRFPSVATDDQGRVYVVFTSRRKDNDDIVLRVFDGKTWLKDRIVSHSPKDEFDGRVVTDGKGGAWLSWTSNAEGDKYDLVVAHLPNPTSPITPTRITSSDDDAMHARMARDANGLIWVTYYKWRKMGRYSRDREVYARYFDGKTWSDEIHVSPDDVPVYEDHCDPAITPWGDSVAVAWSWDYHRPRGYTRSARLPTVFLRPLSAKGKPGPIRAVSSIHIDSIPTIAAGPGKDLWCAWESIAWDRASRADRKRVAIVSCDPEAPVKPTPGENVSGIKKNICSPSLSTSPSGTAALVWAEQDAKGHWGLKLLEFDPRQDSRGKPKRLRSKHDPRFPSAAYSPDGNLWIAYSAELKNGVRKIVVSKKTDMASSPASQD